MNKKHVIIALAIGLVIGAAYGRRIPGVSTVAGKLPGASV